VGEKPTVGVDGKEALGETGSVVEVAREYDHDVDMWLAKGVDDREKETLADLDKKKKGVYK
jgi:hypothetical protein